MTETIVVPFERAGLELDEFLCLHFPEFNKGFLRRAVREGQILLDGMRANPSQRRRADQVLIVDLDDQEPPTAPVAPEAELPILYEDEDLLVVDKPAGLAVEPERWARGAASLAGALLAMAHARSPDGDGAPLELRLRAVHRLDKNTTGALVVAKPSKPSARCVAPSRRTACTRPISRWSRASTRSATARREEIDLALGPDEKRSGRWSSIPREARAHASPWSSASAASRGSSADRSRGARTRSACTSRPPASRWRSIRSTGGATRLLLSNVKAGYRAKRGRPERR
jgi:23S rRNA-/tRNA-specific pseudouridylate synthase